MKHNYIFSSLILALLLLFGGSSSAQLSGTITIPSAPKFPDLKAVVDSLNQYGLSGPVTIDLTADQNAPSGGYVLGTSSSRLNSGTTSTSSGRTITIKGNGHMVTANTGTGTSDGIFIIAGVDYVTIDSLNLRDLNAASGVDAMEWGYALLKHSATAPFDGAQHITISNCIIALNLSSATTTGIYSGNHTLTGTPELSGNNAVIADANRDNRFSKNTIYNCSRGIYMKGLTGGVLLDNNNVISDNQITVGGTTVAAIGIYSAFDSSATITGNTIKTAPDHAAAVSGIEIRDGKGNVRIRNNTIGLTSRSASATHNGILLTNVRTNGNQSLLEITGNKLSEWSMTAATAGDMYMIYNNGAAFDSVRISGNEISDIRLGVDPSTSFGMNFMYVIYNKVGGTTSFIETSRNTIKNISRISAAGSVTLLFNSTAASTNGVCNIHQNVISGVTNNTTINGIIISPGNNLRLSALHNKLMNISATNEFSGDINLFYPGSSLVDPPSTEIAYDTLMNISTNGGTINGFRFTFPKPLSMHHNYVNNISTSKGRITVLDYNGGSSILLYNNIIGSLSVNGAGGPVRGILIDGFSYTLSAYNNFITGLKVSGAYTATNNIIAMSLNGTFGLCKVFNNTIKIDPQTTTGADLGATGILFSNLTSLDLRNNIVNVNMTPKGAGSVVALRRSSGTGGTPPDNLLMSSNGNIYYTPNADSSYLYAEGTTHPLVNRFRAQTANINPACGAYKQFMNPRESRSFMENNLFAGLIPGIWSPAGLSYAEGTGVATYNPQIVSDFAGVARPAQPDAGALEFSGTSQGVAGPVIDYAPLPRIDYCTNTNPTLTANITGSNPINVSAGTAPRLYYRKAAEKDTFGVYPGNNTSSFNGWKYVEATGTAPNFSFTILYNRLTGAVAAGDSIVYFIIAQDNAAIPNVAVNMARFATGYCTAGVNLSSAAGPLFAEPALNGYKLVTGNFNTVSLNGNVCVGATTILKIDPQPTGITYRWQHDNNTGTFVDIPGATDSLYTTPPLDTANNYRAIIGLCGTTDTSAPVHVSVTIPRIVDSLPASRCGSGSLTLQATGSAGTVLKWYNVPAGGVHLDTGTSFTTPFLNTTTDYYVSALNGNGGEIIPSPAGDQRTPYGTWASVYSSYGQFFSVNTPVTINSVKTYLSTDNPQIAQLSVWIYDMINTTAPPFMGTSESFMIDTAMKAYTIPVNATLPVGRYKMELVTSLGNFSSLYTTAGNYPYYSMSGAVAVTGGGAANPNLADYYFLYDWSINAGCESPRTRVTATIDTVTAFITPPTGTKGCAGDSVTLFASSNIGYTYQWQQNNTDIANARSSAYNVKGTGSYRVIVTSGTCTDTSDTVGLTFYPVPTPVITPGGAGNRTLTTGVYTSYQWYYEGLELFGETGRSHTAIAPGRYSVRVTDANGCSGMSADYTVSVGVEHLGSGTGIRIYPNPASDLVHITSAIPVTATITSAEGKIVRIQDNAKTLNIGSFAPGIYLIRITDDKGHLIHIEKLVRSGL